MRIAIVRQRAPEDLQKHVRLSAMVHGERYEAFHDMIESYFGADEEEQMDNTYGALEIGFASGAVQAACRYILPAVLLPLSPLLSPFV